ncbi:MAG: bifunctional DNA primase/polymerase, partial [Actinopolymorphaceae bacterium]
IEVRNTAGRLGWKIDTRASGGYVVAPGSVIAGVAYTVVVDLPPAPLPAWIVDQLTTTPLPEKSGSAMPADRQRRREYVAAAIRGELSRVLTAPPRTRNISLFKAASQLGQLVATGDLDQAVAHAALVTVGQAVGQSATEANKTVASGLRNGATKPREAAA